MTMHSGDYGSNDPWAKRADAMVRMDNLASDPKYREFVTKFARKRRATWRQSSMPAFIQQQPDIVERAGDVLSLLPPTDTLVIDNTWLELNWLPQGYSVNGELYINDTLHRIVSRSGKAALRYPEDKRVAPQPMTEEQLVQLLGLFPFPLATDKSVQNITILADMIPPHATPAEKLLSLIGYMGHIDGESSHTTWSTFMNPASGQHFAVRLTEAASPDESETHNKIEVYTPGDDYSTEFGIEITGYDVENEARIVEGIACSGLSRYLTSEAFMRAATARGSITDDLPDRFITSRSTNTSEAPQYATLCQEFLTYYDAVQAV